jgi:hypothetical protein
MLSTRSIVCALRDLRNTNKNICKSTADILGCVRFNFDPRWSNTLSDVVRIGLVRRIVRNNSKHLPVVMPLPMALRPNQSQSPLSVVAFTETLSASSQRPFSLEWLENNGVSAYVPTDRHDVD